MVVCLIDCWVGLAQGKPYAGSRGISSLSAIWLNGCCVLVVCACGGVQASDVPSLLRAKAELETRCQMLEAQLAKLQVGGWGAVQGSAVRCGEVRCS